MLDTGKGTVHLVIGGGGTSAPSNHLLTNPPRCRVITGIAGRRDPATNRRTPTYVDRRRLLVSEPGSDPLLRLRRLRGRPVGNGPTTAIHATYYAVTGPYGALSPVDRFTLVRPRIPLNQH